VREALQEHGHALGQGARPAPEALAAALAAAPLVVGADGVRVLCRPMGGQPRGQTRWHEGKVGVLARVGQQRPRPGKGVPRLRQRRQVALWGDIEALTPRGWLAAVRQSLSTAPEVVWRRAGARGLWRRSAERVAASAITSVGWRAERFLSKPSRI